MDIVVVYITNPVSLVMGEFDVRQVIHDRVRSLWDRTKAAAGIKRELFFAYFKGRDYGYAIEIGEVRLYDMPLRLDQHFRVRPPQSFMYLD